MWPPARTPAASLAVLLLAGCSGRPEPPLSVVLVVVDTLRADHVLEVDRVATPRLDRLLAESVVFTRAFAHCSWTLPSHTALFSSRPPYETGVRLNSQLVPRDLPLLAEWMQRQGYATRAVHSLVSLLPVEAGQGLDRGFDTFDSRLELGFARAEVVHSLVEPVIADLARGERPFFLFVHYSDPHEPLDAFGTAVVPARLTCNGRVVHEVANLAQAQWIRARVALDPGRNELRLATEARCAPRSVRALRGGVVLPVAVEVDAQGELYGVIENDSDAPVEVEFMLYASEQLQPAEQRRRYKLEIEYLDRFLGQLEDALLEHGLAQRVLLVLTADHGEGLGEHNEPSHGTTVFDEVLHVPLLFRPPAQHPRLPALAAGRDQLARHVDVVPTILDLLDLPALPGQTGTSLCQRAERTLEAEAHYPLDVDLYALFDGRHKLVYVAERDAFVMFDLERDPDETTDVLAEVEAQRDLSAEKERLRAMRARGAETAVGLPPDLPEELRMQLEAMGYAGGR